jgi:hypothetical protein
VPGLVSQNAGDVLLGTMIQVNAASTEYCHKYSQHPVINFQSK